MSSKRNSSSKIDPEQRELIERAQERARQKRGLYQHFILFLIGAAVLIVLNVVFEIGQDIKPFGIDWFVWAIIVWGIILLAHVFNVFVTKKFLGKDWENRQVEKLVARQHRRIEELQRKVEKEYPLPNKHEPYIPPVKEDHRIDPDSPINS